jgi:hypothetical protein
VLGENVKRVALPAVRQSARPQVFPVVKPQGGLRVVNRYVGKRGQIAACMAAGAKAAQRAIDKALAPKKKRSHRPE